LCCTACAKTRVHTAGLRGKLPESIALPASVTVPFGSFEEALSQPANADVRKRLQAAIDRIPPTAAEPALAECRDIVMEVNAPQLLSPHT
jgi:alpha-glucan,water dikinase